MMSDRNMLSGAELEQLMDRLETDLEEGGSAEEIDLLARLRAHPLRADSMESIDRLHTLWMIAGDPVAARAVINNDGAALLQAAGPDAQAEIEMLLVFQRLNIAEYLEEEDAICNELSRMRTIVTENPGFDVSLYDQLPIFDRLEEGRLDVALETVALCHALDLAMEDRAAFRAWDEANHQYRRALAFKRHGCDDQARMAATAAMGAFQMALSGQDVDANDWLYLGDMLVEIAPEQLGAFRQKVMVMAAECPLEQRREIEAKLARFTLN